MHHVPVGLSIIEVHGDGMSEATLQHEQMRINTMTDDQLVTRYGKMRNAKKIQAFAQVLHTMGRATELQHKIREENI